MSKTAFQTPATTRVLLDFEEAADFLRSSRSSVYRMIRRGELKPVKLGGRTLFRRIDLDDLVERCAARSA